MQIWEFNSLILFNLVQPFRMVAFLMVLASKMVIPSGVPYCSWSGPLFLGGFWAARNPKLSRDALE